MSNKFLLAAAALTVSLSACNDSNLPTEGGRDLLNNPAGAPALGGSKYGQVLVEYLTETGAVKDTIRIQPPDISVPPETQPWIGYEHETNRETGNYSKYKLPGWEHIADEFNRSKYKPIGTEHIKTGVNATRYKPAGWVHYGGPPAIDNTKYLPPGYEHITSGPHESKYRKPTPVTPPDTTTPGGPGVPSGGR